VERRNYRLQDIQLFRRRSFESFGETGSLKLFGTIPTSLASRATSRQVINLSRRSAVRAKAETPDSYVCRWS